MLGIYADGDQRGKIERLAEAPSMFRSDASHSGQTSGRDVNSSAKLLWQFKAGGAVYSSPLPSGKSLYIGSDDGKLYALDRQSGEVRWTFAADGPIRSTAAADGENVYLADRTGGLYALDADDGSLQWKLAGGSDGKPLDPWDYYDSSPVLAGRTLFYGSGDHKLYAVDTKTGQVKWSYDTGYPVRSTPAYRAGTVYVGDWFGYLHAVDAATGKRKWAVRHESDITEPAEDGGYTYYHGTIQASPTVSDDVVYYGSRDSYLFARDAATGAEQWKFAAANSWISSSTALRDGVLYVGGSDSKRLYAIDAASGKELWSAASDSNILASPIVSRDTVYYASGDAYAPDTPGTIYAADRKTGEFRWSRKTEGPVHASPAVADGTLYYADALGNVAALR
jgi:outer membrane protein assembly factor BamB